jgi:sterol desaturase/sphingolipid hydroxylase (fatty acid hydroxylase superfamily)
MDAPGLLAAIESELHWGPELGWYVVAVAMALPLEVTFGSREGASWSERLGNVAAMLIHFAIGGVALHLVLATPIGQQISAFPRGPRYDWLSNPFVWALSFVVLLDAAFYGYHRLQHAVPLLWRIHKLHHTDPAMNVTTSRRTHFAERTLQHVFVRLPVLWALGMNLEGTLYATAISWFFLYTGHVDVRIDLGFLTPILVGPLYHRVHHGRSPEIRDANFAQVFPVLDILGGTYRRPVPREDVATGVDGCDTAYARWHPVVW